MIPAPLRFLADADLRNAIVLGVRRQQPALDILTAHEGQIIGVPDPQVLTIATHLDRILVSHDVNTMPAHFRTFLQQGNHSPGLILIHQYTPIGAAIEAVSLVWGASLAEDWFDTYDFLP